MTSGNLKDDQTVVPLVNALRDEDYSVRRVVAGALLQIGKVAVQPLIQLLGDEDSTIRETTVTLLGDLSNRKAIKPLVAVLQDRVSIVRSKVAQALERFEWKPENDALWQY